MSIAPDTATAASVSAPKHRGRRARRLRRCCIALACIAAVAGAAFAVCWHVFPFPQQRLDRWPTSPLVTDRRGGAMLELVAADEQWRFSVPLTEISP